MAEVLGGFQIEEAKAQARGVWRRYLDGQVWKITRGVDFLTEIANARSGLYMACMRNFGPEWGVRSVRIAHERGGESIAVQLYRRAPEQRTTES